MLKKITGIMTAAALTLPLIPASMPMASAADGSDWTIENETQLREFYQTVAAGNTYSGQTVKLSADIMLSNSWTPIGTSSYPFKGTFDGQGHTISGITGFMYAGSEYRGLFGYVDGGTIKNVQVSGSVTVDSDSVGGIVGCLQSGTVSSCHNDISITSTDNSNGSSVGGIAGYNGGTVENCYNTGSINANYNVGGIVGNNWGEVKYCHDQGSVTSATASDIGAIVGNNASAAAVTSCFYKSGLKNGEALIYGVGSTYGRDDETYTKALSTSEMKEQGSFTGFDFTNVWKMGDNYPVLDFDKLCGWNDHIEDLDELMQLRDWVNDGTLLTQYPAFTTYYLDNDIDMSSVDNWTPIGNSSSNPFTITFDGQEHTIRNLKVEGTSGYEGLFGLVNGDIRKLNVSGTVKGNIEAGLIAARISGISTQTASIKDCTANGTVTGRNSIGGIVGAVSGYVDMIRCEYTGGQLSADETVGGIAGFVSGTTDTSTGTWFGNCVNSSYGNITATNSKAGGIAGHAKYNVVFSECEYKGSGYVTAPNSAGGIAGSLEAALSYAPSARNCSSADTSHVSGKTNIGGIVGKTSKANSSTTASVAVSGCTNAAEVRSSSDEREAGVTQNYGGIIGSNSGSVTDCTAKGYVLGHDNVGGAVGYNAGTVTGCTYSGGTVSGYKELGGIAGKNDTGGTVSACTNSGTVKDSANISTQGSESGFAGGIVGYNLGTVTGYCTNYGEVSGADRIGGIAGRNSGTVELSHNEGIVTGTNYYAGGVAGKNEENALVENCYNKSNVTGASYTGGVVGSNSGTVRYCHGIGNVATGSLNAKGGIVGANESTGKVFSCRFLENGCAPVSYSVSGSYVDDNTSILDAGGMSDETNFIGWDFNTNSIWTINKTLGAPDFFDMKLTDTGKKSTGYYIDTNAVYHENATGFIVNLTYGKKSPEKAYIGWKVTPEGGKTMTFEPSEITSVNIDDGTEIVIGLIVTELADENAELKAYALYE